MLPDLLLVAFVLLAILQLNRFLQLCPYLWDSVFRARGSSSLESSVRLSHDRNLLALSFLIPAVLLLYRYRLYDPAFLQGWDENLRLLALVGVLVAYLLVRRLLYLWLKPRRRGDNYRLAHRTGFTNFILLMLILLPTVGILSLFHCNDLTIRNFIYGECAVVYLFFLLRRAQILSLICNPLRTFLYLCALEFLPTALLVVSAILL